MTLYWIYDLPNWMLGTLIVTAFVGLALVGLFRHAADRRAAPRLFVQA